LIFPLLKNRTGKIIFPPWKLEASMETYEIRILRFDGKPALIAQQKYLNAQAAITAAKLMATGRRFEVWNEDYCVFTSAVAPQPYKPPPQPAA
jgi:hypothetical protein